MKVSLRMRGVVSCILLAATLAACGCDGDTAAPSNVSVLINNGAASTSDTSVTLWIAASDNTGVAGYYISETSTIPSATAPDWTAVTSTTSYSADVPFTLSSGDETKTIYVWFRDDAGNVSAPANASITLASTISMITPYVNETDMTRVGSFSSSSSCPWGFAHKGIDIFAAGNLKPFQAVCSGVVEKVELWQPTEYWQIDVFIRFNSAYLVLYAFEPCTTSQSDGEIQLANILVSEGQTVSQGDIIGYFYTARPECAAVHFGLYEIWDGICPEPYFTPEARDSILRLVHNWQPDWVMCY